MTTQASFLEKMIPHLEKDGLRYRKWRMIKARPAIVGEYIETITEEGLETVNTAKEGDFLVQNTTTAGEYYLVPGHKFESRYEKAEDLNDEGWATYKPSGQVIGLQMKADTLLELHLPTSFEFIAPWGAPMKCDVNDFVVCPPTKDEVYVIGHKEFLETYALAE